MSESSPPKDIDPKRKAYAFERSLGIPMAEACRRAGGKVANGHATKWEKNKHVQAWIAHYKRGDLSEEITAAKRERIESALNAIAYGDGAEFSHADDKTSSAPEYVHRLNALAQLRDMHGFKAPSRTELSGKDGAPIQIGRIERVIVDVPHASDSDREGVSAAS